MREEGSGRGALPTGGVPYAKGDTVISVADNERGTVLSVGGNAITSPWYGTVTVQWASGSVPVVYPDDSQQIRKPWPWE